MTEHEKKVRQLKKGDIISFGIYGDGDDEIIDEIIFDNNDGDLRASAVNRVTINGYHWNISDVFIVSSS